MSVPINQLGLEITEGHNEIFYVFEIQSYIEVNGSQESLFL